MASSTSSTTCRETDIVDIDHPSLADVKTTLRSALVAGSTAPEEQIDIRTKTANSFIYKYDSSFQRNPELLLGAIEHTEVILRLLPDDSPERPTHLNRLSYARMSEYLVSRSLRSIDEAVLCGQLAKREADVTGLKERNVTLYCEIVNNAGFALSHRASSGVDIVRSDQDEAIELGQELKAITDPGSEDYLTAITNLASRFHIRSASYGGLADYEEAVELLREVQSICSPGSMRHGVATMQLGQMAVAKFNKSDILEDLDAALWQINEGLKAMPANFELRSQNLHQVTDLYSSRYSKTRDVADLRRALNSSNETLCATSALHRIRGKYLLQYMRVLLDFTHNTASIQEIDAGATKAQSHLTSMPPQYQERGNCRRLYGDVLVRKYILSQNLDHLDIALCHVKDASLEYNTTVEKSGTKPLVDTSFLYSLLRHVHTLSQAPPGQTRDTGAKYLHGQIEAACSSPNFANGLFKIQRRPVSFLAVYADAAHNQEAITIEDAKKRVEDIELKEMTKIEDRMSRPQWKPEPYKTSLGQRSLAMDPNTKKIIFDFRGLGLLPYSATKPASYEEFAADQLQAEKDSLEKVKAAGKHPNSKLCHMCRLIKPLGPMADKIGGGHNFQWENECSFFPFGTWNQLKLRQHCSICKLVFSLIIADPVTKSLQPSLAAIDVEIQGTQLHVKEVLSSGESVLTVEYGFRQVGEIRMVTESNYTTALRQGWEDNEQHREFCEVAASISQEGQVNPASSQQVDIRQLKRWLTDCELNHTGECNPNVSHRAEIGNIPLILIDVVNNCLVPSTSTVKYFALSYVWGAANISPTLLANYQARCQKGGLPTDQLVKTIADAIVLVRALNERYIWVDALCIVQDDVDRKVHDIKRMDVIYSQAFATVVALSGTTADAGLPGVRPNTRPPQRVETLILNSGSSDLDYPEISDASETTTVHLAATPRPVNLALETSSWDSRGWTFQERLLSRRCLYFADQCVYFQCGRWREQIVAEGSINEPMRYKDPRDDSWNKIPIMTLLDNPLHDLLQDHGFADLPPEKRLTKAFAAYAKLVENYTTRKLSYDADIINAFLGTFAALNKLFQSEMTCGLPEAGLDLALLWAPAGKLVRRKHNPYSGIEWPDTGGRAKLKYSLSTNRGTAQQVYGPVENGPIDDMVDRRFPSWSWAGWAGPAEYRLFADMHPEEPLPISLIREFSISLNGKEGQTIPARKLQQTPRGGTTSSVASTTPNDTDTTPLTPPSLPNILQFLAPTLPLTTFTLSADREYISSQSHIHASTPQAVRPILDRHGVRCGLWWEQTGYVYVGRGISPAAESKMTLVAVSRHEDTFAARRGPSRVEGEIELFGEGYPTVGLGSGLVNVMAMDEDMGHSFGERMTVARIHVRAWEEAGPVVRMVRLV